jgi:Protein of unknown function (DUF3221)
MRHTSRALAASAVLFVLGVAVVGGCGGATTAQPASPSPSAPPPVPADITGVVGDLTVGADSLPVLLVIADPGAAGPVDRASVRVTRDTVVWTAEGLRGAASDLARGGRVAVWFSGPVAESYPVQATAGVVQIQLSD